MLWRRTVINDIGSDPEWNGGDYGEPPTGWLRGYEILRMMIDGVPHLQAIVPDGQAADRLIEDTRKHAEAIDANDILYSLKSSVDYDPEPSLASIRTKVFALNFDDDEFNPAALHVLERLIGQIPFDSFIVQPGSETSFGHLTMAHPELVGAARRRVHALAWRRSTASQSDEVTGAPEPPIHSFAVPSQRRSTHAARKNPYSSKVATTKRTR